MANPLVAQAHSSTTWYTGLGLVEDVAQVSSGIHNHSWVDGTLGGVGGALDILGMAIDPIGSLVAWGVSWLMEHLKPLKEALDWLAGNPDEISAHAQTWKNVSQFTDQAREEFADAVRMETAQWVGDSGDAYREHAGIHLQALEGISKATNAISYAVEGAGLLVGLVRGIVRDLIAQFIATLAARLPQWLAEEGLTLGLGTPVVIGQVTALVAKWVNKIKGFIEALLRSLKRLRPLVDKLGELLTELRTLLKKLGRSDPLKHEPGVDTPGWSGARYVEDPDPAAALAYERIRNDTGDVSAIADNLGVDPSIIDKVKQHLFVDEHDVPTGPGQVGRGNFTADERIADLWTKARNGSLSDAESAEFKRLLSHEYVESSLMDQGLPYRSSDPGAYDEDGLNWPTADHHGAHDLSPLVDPKRDPFAHWPGLGKDHPGITIADDLSNLDDVVRAAQGG